LNGRVGLLANPLQHTLKKPVNCSGIGLHSGREVQMTINPAKSDNGIRFKRTDLGESPDIPAFMNRVVGTTLATTIAEHGIKVATTEHLMAALAAMGIDNANIELDGGEVPIMDGSAFAFVAMLREAGRRQQREARKFVKVTRPITLHDEDRSIRILPYRGFRITATIDFDHPMIGCQTYVIDPDAETFSREIAAARTFGFLEEVEQMRHRGLALGGSMENAVVLDRSTVLNREGLRFADEFVRHKILDIIGDLALLGCPLMGHVIAHKSGHGQHLGVMQEIAATPEAWEFVEMRDNGQFSVLDTMFHSTMAAGNRLLPFLMPPESAPLPASAMAV